MIDWFLCCGEDEKEIKTPTIAVVKYQPRIRDRNTLPKKNEIRFTVIQF